MLVIKAEEIYTVLLRQGLDVRPGVAGDLSAERGGWRFTFRASVVANAVWRRGRVFLTCPLCHGRCTRLYGPRNDSPLACRTCWGLTYESRQHANYKDRGRWTHRGWGTPRDMAQSQTERERERRYAASVDRWAQRRRFLSSSS